MAEIILGTLALAAGVILLAIWLLERVASGVAASKGVDIGGGGLWLPLIGLALLVLGALSLFG